MSAKTSKISVRFPKSYPISEHVLVELKNSNSSFWVSKGRGNSILIKEHDFLLDDTRRFEFYIQNFTEEHFEALCKLNKNKPFKFQFTGNSIHIKMGTFGIISAITAAILIAIGNWVQLKNRGRVYTEEGEYKLKNPDDNKRNIRVKPDISYISYDKADETKQDEWIKTYITVAPSLAVEIVSAKNGLKPALKKMKTIWMRTGTELGLVICPFSKKIYVFDAETADYSEQSIFEPFAHAKLPDFVGDFSKFADKV